MTRIPELERELTAAARRRARPARARRSRRTLVLAAAVALSASASAGAVLVATGTVGGESSQRYGAQPPEEFLRYSDRPVVVAVGERNDFRYELAGYRQGRPGAPGELCLDVAITRNPAGDPGLQKFGCFSPKGHAQGQTSSNTQTLLVGATAQPATRIRIDYTIGNNDGRADAVIARASDVSVLRRIGINAPFVFYVAPIPGDPQRASAHAFNSNGARLWSTTFDIAPEPALDSDSDG